MKHPVDAHVGKRIRHRRWMVGMTQQQLADRVGIKFQQIQKYETGMNRVSASRLWDIAETLGVNIGFFFEGIDEAREAPSPVRPAWMDRMCCDDMSCSKNAKAPPDGRAGHHFPGLGKMLSASRLRRSARSAPAR